MSVIALPTETGLVVGAPMSYWRTVAWRLARDPATLVAGVAYVTLGRRPPGGVRRTAFMSSASGPGAIDAMRSK